MEGRAAKSLASKDGEKEKCKETNEKEPPKLRRSTLEQTGLRFLRELYKLIKAAGELHNQIMEKGCLTLEQMDSIRMMLRPNLERLDENVIHVDQFVQASFGQCRTNDPRARWLLLYHKAMVKFRQVERRFAAVILDEMETICTLKLRGCDRLAKRPDFNDELKKITDDLKRLDEHLQDDLIGWLPIAEF
uniref:BAR domain-containing protein n=1 Tax=Trichuris muris TaxID=70415 RepID=A0A5S6QX72_TRIMR